MSIPFKTYLAPMVEQCDLAFRLLVRKYNCDYCFTQMFHSSLVSKKKEYFANHFTTSPEDKPLIVQLCGHDPDEITQSAKYVLPFCENVDLNLGCPQGIARKGHYGAFLLADYDQVERIVTQLHLEGIPFSVKIRLLPDLNDTLRLCEMIQSNGVKFMTVHGRLKEQKREFTGPCNWEAISTIVKNSSVPIIANGGIDCMKTAKQCVEETGVSGVMSGEALLENPALFSENQCIRVETVCNEYLDLEKEHPSQPKEIRKHLFKLLYRALQMDTKSRDMLAIMPMVTEEDKNQIRDLIRHLAEFMESRKDPWLLDNCTLLDTSWYKRYRCVISYNKQD